MDIRKGKHCYYDKHMCIGVEKTVSNNGKFYNIYVIILLFLGNTAPYRGK